MATLSKEEALQIVGGLSRTRKMPCHSWGLPTSTCQLGARLAQMQESVCASCYAAKGNYAWPNVQAANARRYARREHPEWIPAMVTLVHWQARVNCQPYFRWFDSGDVQSVAMLERIVCVAQATPEIAHWLPTREHGLVREYLAQSSLPANLTVRVSAHVIDHAPPRVAGLPTSTVHRTRAPQGYACPAYAAKPASCYTCRACWDRTIPNISYPHH